MKQKKQNHNSILGGKPEFKDHPNYTKALAIKTPDTEIVKVTNPITGKTADIVIQRNGTTDQKLAMVLLSPDATKDQKDSYISNYLFERGKENSSFLAELYLSKGAHLKETQAFKRQMRFDFESFANTIVLLFGDIADDIAAGGGADFILDDLKNRFRKGAELITKQREQITESRMREKGYGVYLDKQGIAYSIFDNEIEEVVRQEREEVKNKKKKI